MGIFSALFGSKALKRGNNNAFAAQTKATNEALGVYKPFEQVGNRGFSQYADAIGVGDDQAGIDAFKSSPLYRLNYDAMIGAGQNAVGAMGTAAGLRNSGATLKALADRASSDTNKLFGQYVSPLAQMADFGSGVADKKVGLITGQGQNAADYFNRRAEIKAGKYAAFDKLATDGVKLGFKALSGGFG